MATSSIVLHQFRASHYNDKVRWALAFKGLKHERVSHLPGPHQIPIKKLSGQTSTPVLVLDGRAIAGSAVIIDALETKFPEPRLFPADSAGREKALGIVDRFDREVGPATRTAAFTVFVNELGYVSRLFGGDASTLKRGIYRMMLPLVKPLMAKTNGVTDPANVAKAFDTIRLTLDWIAQETHDRFYLVGDRFSVADLTVAALMSPIVKLEHPDMRAPEPVPEALMKLLAEWKDHPAVQWVQRQYRENRPVDPN